jgi:hypothetical protein
MAPDASSCFARRGMFLQSRAAIGLVPLRDVPGDEAERDSGGRSSLMKKPSLGVCMRLGKNPHSRDCPRIER